MLLQCVFVTFGNSYGNGTYVVEQEAGCFVVRDINLDAYRMCARHP